MQKLRDDGLVSLYAVVEYSRLRREGTMGQILRGCATTTEAVRRAIQHSQESLMVLAGRYGINPKTMAKWRKRAHVTDARMGPKEVRSTVLTPEEEAAVVAFRRHTLLPLDDCLYVLQASIPNLTCFSLHRCLQRHDISKLSDIEGDKTRKKSSLTQLPISPCKALSAHVNSSRVASGNFL